MKAITKFKKAGVKVRHFAPNHTVIQTGYGNAFQSYDSIVAFVGDGTVTLGPDWDYSRTTMKYLGQWLGRNAKEIRQRVADGTYTIDKDL